MMATSRFAETSKAHRDKLLYDAVPKSTMVATAFGFVHLRTFVLLRRLRVI